MTTGEAQSSPESPTGEDNISNEAFMPTMITEAKTWRSTKCMTRNTSKEEAEQHTSSKTTSVKNSKTAKASTAKSKAKTMKRKVIEMKHIKEKVTGLTRKTKNKHNRVQIRRNKSKVLVHTLVSK